MPMTGGVTLDESWQVDMIIIIIKESTLAFRQSE